MGLCTYDDCLDDSGCGASVPCECRASDASGVANTCQKTSDCRVDADCGPGGFCSPSVVGAFCQCQGSPALCDASARCYVGATETPCLCGDNCGHGYYCHTPADACTDDEDCAADETCNYDRVLGRWTCSVCWPVP
jgi:hypothetical protein